MPLHPLNSICPSLEWILYSTLGVYRGEAWSDPRGYSRQLGKPPENSGYTSSVPL